MKLLLVLLTGYALFSRPGHVSIRGGTAAARDRPIRGHYQAVTTHDQVGADYDQVAAGHDQVGVDQAQIRLCCQKIARDMQRVYYLNSRNGKMKLVVRGIYTRSKLLFFSLKLINRSALDYDVGSIRFFVAEKQKGAHSLQRVTELAPTYVYDSASLVKGYNRVTSVFVLQRLTLARRHRLQIEVLEKNGGRHLLVQAANFTLETARLI